MDINPAPFASAKSSRGGFYHKIYYGTGYHASPPPGGIATVLLGDFRFVVMFRSGSFVAEHLTPVDPAQVQPNGVDLTADAILAPKERGRIGRDGKRIADRRPVDPDDEAGAYVLSPGGYVLRYGETVSVPEGHVGFVYPRSSLMRNACMLHTAVWDAGYEGRGEGLLAVHRGVEIEPGARVAQFVLARANHDGVYDGSYQGENVDGER
jgi:deoxycytidine triphosphate deaminase